MLTVDTETTGVDLYHGAKPFFVSTCDEDGVQRSWEWDVDPLTREVLVDKADLADIYKLLVGQRLVLQNAKFDITALKTIAPRTACGLAWDRIDDTLVAAHLLASNQPHDLTALAMNYLGVDIAPYEDAVKKATTEARRLVQQARLKLKRATPEKLFGGGGVRPGSLEDCRGGAGINAERQEREQT